MKHSKIARKSTEKLIGTIRALVNKPIRRLKCLTRLIKRIIIETNENIKSFEQNEYSGGHQRKFIRN